MSKSSENGKIFGSLLLGTIVGAVVGILFAPKSGKETRDELMAEAEKLRGELEKYANDFSDKAKQARADLEERLRKTEKDIESLDEDLGV